MQATIRAPSQARSRKTMDQVYRSLDVLLRERTFDQLTIADLANHAGVAVGSIYARFKDKNALLTGAYLSACNEAEHCLARLSSPSRWHGHDDGKMLHAIISAIDRFYRQKGHILVAALLGNVTEIEAKRVDLWQQAFDSFAELLKDRHPGTDPAMLKLVVQIAIRFVTSVMQQAMIIGQVNQWKGRVSNKLIIDELGCFVLDLLHRAEDGTLGER